MTQAEESALVILVPAAEPIVSNFRERFDRSAIRGMPAHVTVLYPFRHPDRISEELTSDLASFFSTQQRLRFKLVGLAGFPNSIYLLPEPLQPFDAMTRFLADRYPDSPPYAGAFANPTPHLTVAQTPPAASLESVAGEVFDAVAPSLPIRCEARTVTLALKREGRWSLGRAFELAD